MFNRSLSGLSLALGLFAALAAAPGVHAHDDDRGSIFTLTNSPDGNAVVAFPAKGGRAVSVCTECEADWAPGGMLFVVRGFTQPRSLVIALAPGEALPRLPPGGLRSEADAAGLHVVSADDGFRYPGRDASQYAYVKWSIQRNIYRVPLP